MRLGMTGTSSRITGIQYRRMCDYIYGVRDQIVTAHHGDCIGADRAFNHVVREFAPSASIHIHPPTISAKRAFCQGDVLHPVKPYLERNRDIVLTCDYLLVVPLGYIQTIRSGTWYTYRQMRKLGKSGIIFWPDGRLEHFYGG
jgi:hypothetical protein